MYGFFTIISSPLPFLFHHSVASPPTVQSAEQVSPGTTIRVTWSHPSGGAAVTGYLVHYNGGGDEGSVSSTVSATTADLEDLLNDGRTYTISVEAQSDQISGESNIMNVPLRESIEYSLHVPIGCGHVLTM